MVKELLTILEAGNLKEIEIINNNDGDLIHFSFIWKNAKSEMSMTKKLIQNLDDVMLTQEIFNKVIEDKIKAERK